MKKSAVRLAFSRDDQDRLPVQIAASIKKAIEKGLYTKNDHLPSINIFSRDYKVSRDTVERAYTILKDSGHIHSVPAKGYFVSGRKSKQLKILLVFNKLSSYKKLIYDSFVETLGEKATVDLYIHHYDPKRLKEILENADGKYHYYVVMPHFMKGTKSADIKDLFLQFAHNDIILLDKSLHGTGRNYTGVYQDFRLDIFQALESAHDLLKKYKGIRLVFPSHSNHPAEIVKGVKNFCEKNKLSFAVEDGAGDIKPRKNITYILLTESDLAILYKKIKQSGLTPGKDIGLISFNETVLKELLDITVITTDFEAMGRETARLILENRKELVRNNFVLIRRSTL